MLLGRVAKIPGGKRQTFLQQNTPGSIDTFRASMLKYYEKSKNTEGDSTMQKSAMCTKLNKQFASGFAVGSLFPFFVT